MELIEKLTNFGLTRQEALIYLTLCTDGEMTGYETAKVTGISRSNAYTALAGLVDKGAAYLVEGNAARYSCVPFREYSANFLRRLERIQGEILEEFPKKKNSAVFDGYMTIRGREHILDKILHMTSDTEYRLYICVPPDILNLLDTRLQALVSAGKKVVIFAPEGYSLKGAKVYPSGHSQMQAPSEQALRGKVYLSGTGTASVRLIVDSTKVLTGQLNAADPENSTCLYSMNRNLVEVFKDMMKNEILLLEHGLR